MKTWTEKPQKPRKYERNHLDKITKSIKTCSYTRKFSIQNPKKNHQSLQIISYQNSKGTQNPYENQLIQLFNEKITIPKPKIQNTDRIEQTHQQIQIWSSEFDQNPKQNWLNHTQQKFQLLGTKMRTAKATYSKNQKGQNKPINKSISGIKTPNRTWPKTKLKSTKFQLFKIKITKTRKTNKTKPTHHLIFKSNQIPQQSCST